MYHDLHKFGKAYQEELQRSASRFDKHEFEGRKQRPSQEQGLLARLVGLLLGRRKRTQPYYSPSIREPRSRLSG
jgi:hypothetical protein